MCGPRRFKLVGHESIPPKRWQGLPNQSHLFIYLVFRNASLQKNRSRLWDQMGNFVESKNCARCQWIVQTSSIDITYMHLIQLLSEDAQDEAHLSHCGI